MDEEFLDRMDQQLAGAQGYPMAEVLVRMHSEEKALGVGYAQGFGITHPHAIGAIAG